MRAVNLLPRDAGTGSGDGLRLPLIVAAAGAAAVTAACAVLAFSASGAIDQHRAELALTESAIAAIPPAGGATAAPGLVVQERTDRVAALSAALSSRIAVDRVLREISYVLPSDAWLTGLIANAPTDAGAAAAPGATPGPASSGVAGVTIQGATFSHESVARVLARLSVLPTLENVRLTASARIQPQTSQSGDGKTQKPRRPVVTFSIEAHLPSGGRP